MNIQLAGFNVDAKAIKKITEDIEKTRATLISKPNLNAKDIQEINQYTQEALKLANNLTPETLAASYARISRDPRPIPELREDAINDIEGSRKSNKAIIFTMGHKSIAEHAILNFDVMGISRRAVEEVEKKRLQSYTEKSQRYITLDGDFVIPKEIKGTPFEGKFIDLVQQECNFYNNHLNELYKWHDSQKTKPFYTELFTDFKITDKTGKQDGVLNGFGKEDARYSLSQATQAQLGLTVSARNLEVLITELRSSSVKEFQEIGEKLFLEIDNVAPSVIKYTKPTDYFVKTRSELKEHVNKLLKGFDLQKIAKKDVTVFNPENQDTAILAGLIFSSSKTSYELALQVVNKMKNYQKIELVAQANKYQEKHDPKLREFELGARVADITMSSSAFAQMKRHRMNTLIPQEYNPLLGHTTPKSIISTGNETEYKRIITASTKLFYEMKQAGIEQKISEYTLTNAHRRKVLLDANNRQIHAIAAERMNLAAQWDIRKLMTEYVGIIKAGSPITMADACGKHAFYKTKEEFQK